MPLPPEQDAYGQIYLAMLEGQKVQEIMERDDGLIYCADTEDYFDPYPKWPEHERDAMRYVQSRVLDVGCGAGRVSLYLQEQGIEVTAIDESPLAVEVSRRRGVRSCRVLSLAEVGSEPGIYDTVLILRNNFGLGAAEGGIEALLRRLDDTTSEHGRIITDSVDPKRVENPAVRVYDHRVGGIHPRSQRFRVRWQRYATPWFDYLMFSPDEMRTLMEDSPWKITQVLDDGSPRYGVVLEKRTSS